MTRFYSKLNTVIGLTGVTIQLTMLYPWHEEISKEIHALQRQQNQLQTKIEALSSSSRPTTPPTPTPPK